jgi:hypothetical protein
VLIYLILVCSRKASCHTRFGVVVSSDSRISHCIPIRIFNDDHGPLLKACRTVYLYLCFCSQSIGSQLLASLWLPMHLTSRAPVEAFILRYERGNLGTSSPHLIFFTYYIFEPVKPTAFDRLHTAMESTFASSIQRPGQEPSPPSASLIYPRNCQGTTPGSLRLPACATVLTLAFPSARARCGPL